MSTPQTLDQAMAEAGELIARHDSASGLEEFAHYRDRDRPLLAFINEELGEDLWARQEDVVASVQDNPRTVVVGGNGVGKDYVAACIALAWCCVYRGLVLVTASGERTAVGVFMRREVAPKFRTAPLPGELRVMRWDIPGTRAGIEAMTSTTAAKIAGFHHPEGTLVIFSEANDVPDFAFEAMAGNALGERDRFLALGNPLSPDGYFYKIARRDTWETIRVPALEHPNIVQGEEIIPGGPSPTWLSWVREEWGEDDRRYVARVEARFPETASDSLVRQEWLLQAVEAHHEGAFADDDFRYTLGVDVARHGPDATVVCLRKGSHVVGFREWRGLDTREAAEAVFGLAQDLHNDGQSPVCRVVVDVVGVGGGVVDALRPELPALEYLKSRRRGYRKRTPTLVEFNGGSKAHDPGTFRNLRSETLWHVRKRLEDGEIALPDDDDLLAELRATRVEFTADGKTAIEPKDRIKSRLGGRSPDRADALAMSFVREAKKAGGKRAWWR